MTNDVKTKIDKICKDLDPTLTISERTKILNSDGCDAKPHQVYYYMKKKYSHKRSRFHPYQRKYVGNVLKRQCFAAKLIDTLEEGKQIVNIDEFGLDFSKRNYGWSEKGSKCLGFKTSMKRFYSIIIAVSNWNGIIAWRAIGENNNAKKFNNFIADLTKYIYSQDRDFREYTVFFLDNSKIHTSAINKELYEKLGLFVLFGTPYTPQFAFVERIISYIKAKVKICEDTLLESLKYSVNKTQEILDMEKIMRNILNSYGSKALKLEDLGD
ncbi:unnamed protein product [Blepharisma stoltei]|uniref:Tc1-like transposase DDE domain-containing protein n=1 Tax=Blepharisma stoltei TaxID=1481888 RepID=A0AAU9JCN1_9CILI|nr:unnamed protein product [Blepharisma stoltei]